MDLTVDVAARAYKLWAVLYRERPDLASGAEGFPAGPVPHGEDKKASL